MHSDADSPARLQESFCYRLPTRGEGARVQGGPACNESNLLSTPSVVRATPSVVLPVLRPVRVDSVSPCWYQLLGQICVCRGLVLQEETDEELPTRPPLHGLLAPCLLKSQAHFFCSSRCLPRCPGVAPDCSVSHLVRVPTGTKHDAALSPPPVPAPGISRRSERGALSASSRHCAALAAAASVQGAS